MKGKTLLIIGLFATILLIGGYYYFNITPSTELIESRNEIDISYEQWSHTVNTPRTYFDVWESDSDAILLYDKDSISSISATLAFPNIVIGEMKLQMRTLSTEFSGQMCIDFKRGNDVVFSIVRDSTGEYSIKTNNSLYSLGGHSLEIIDFYVSWNFNTRNLRISTIRQEEFTHSIYIYTTIESIDEIEIYTTQPTFNSGTLFFFENSYLAWIELL